MKYAIVMAPQVKTIAAFGGFISEGFGGVRDSRMRIFECPHRDVNQLSCASQ